MDHGRDLGIPTLGSVGWSTPWRISTPRESPSVLARKWHGPGPSMGTMGGAVAEVCWAGHSGSRCRGRLPCRRTGCCTSLLYRGATGPQTVPQGPAVSDLGIHSRG